MIRILKAYGIPDIIVNAKKTQFMVYNQPADVHIQTTDGTLLAEVKDFKYLGSWVRNSEQDIKVRKALAWKACNKLTNIWKSTLSRHLKVKLFQATVWLRNLDYNKEN